MREQSIAVKASGSRPKGKRPENNRQAAKHKSARGATRRQEARTLTRTRGPKRQEATIEDARGARRARGSNKTYKSKRLE